MNKNHNLHIFTRGFRCVTHYGLVAIVCFVVVVNVGFRLADVVWLWFGY